jgi:hypothetical protein
VTGDEKKVAGEIKKHNKNEVKRDSLFRHSVQQDIYLRLFASTDSQLSV